MSANNNNNSFNDDTVRRLTKTLYDSYVRKNDLSNDILRDALDRKVLKKTIEQIAINDDLFVNFLPFVIKKIENAHNDGDYKFLIRVVNLAKQDIKIAFKEPFAQICNDLEVREKKITDYIKNG